MTRHEDKRGFRVSGKAAHWIDGILPVALGATGLACEDPWLFYAGLLTTFVILAALVLIGAGLAHLISLRFGARIQGARRKSPPMLGEALETARAMLVIACIAAWPLARHRLGYDTGLSWSIEESGGSLPLILVYFWLGVIAADAVTYWKHRLLHTRAMFAFHAKHHSFRDPTPFAGFAVAPLEALFTFWPIYLLLFPWANHFVPVYLGTIAAFVVLNLYLHCGVTFAWAEKLLPKAMLNSSAHHNWHHSHANVNFGEISFFWDNVCQTSIAHKQRAERSRSVETAA